MRTLPVRMSPIAHVTIASDHRGFDMKQIISQTLIRRLIDVTVCGPDTDEKVDYPVAAQQVIENMRWVHGQTFNNAFGVLICGSGIGISIAANKHRGIRAALCRSVNDAMMARRHNDANVVCIGADVTALTLADQIVHTFITTEFEGGRHEARVEQIES